MELFPRLFLVVFAQLSVGGFLSLSVPPFHDIERGYFKSSAFIYLLLGTLAFAGRGALWLRSTGAAPGEVAELGLWAMFVVFGAGYWWTLWGERVWLRARLFTGTWMVGLIALMVAGISHRPSASLAETIVYPATVVAAAFPLGAVSAGMLLGHWYLIDRSLSLAPFRRILTYYGACLSAQALVVASGSLALALAGSAATAEGFQRLADGHVPLLAARLAVSPLGSGILGVMIWLTLRIPQTMAATGLFYIAILAVLVGEFMGRFLLFRTGLPL